MSILRRKMFFAGDEVKKDFKQDRNEAIKIIQEERKKRGLPSGRGALFSQRDFIDQVRRYMQGESLLSIFPADRFVGSGEVSLPRFDSIQDPTARSNIKPPVPQTFAEPQINRNALIRYYFNQGFNTADILELLPDATLSELEAVAKDVGGIVNPAIRGGESFTGGLDVLQTPDETIVSAPSLTERDQLISDIKAGGGMGPSSVGLNFQPTDLQGIDTLQKSIIELEKPKLLSVDDLEIQQLQDSIQENVLEPVNDLADNQYKDSQGNIHKINPQKFEEALLAENSRVLFGLLNNPDVEYGPNLKSILKKVATARSTTLVPEESIQVGDVPFLNLSELLQSTTKAGVDFGKEGIESLYNLARSPFVSPELRGIFVDRAAEESARDLGIGERINLFDTRLDELKTADRGLKKPAFDSLDDYIKTGGEKLSTLDGIVLQSSDGLVEGVNEIQDEINEINTEQAVESAIVGETEAETETEAQKGEDTKDETTTATKQETDKQGATTQTDRESVNNLINNEALSVDTPENLSGPFSSQPFLRLARNLSKGLASEKDFAQGIAKGAALAADERAAEDAAIQEAALEIKLKQLEGTGIDLGDATKIYEINQDALDDAQTFKNTVSTLGLVKELKTILSEEKPTALSSFALDILEKAKNALGQDAYNKIVGDEKNFKALPSTTRARVLATLISQANIREILGESGRTISNFDRTIVEELSTKIDLGEPAAANITRLSEIERRLTNSSKRNLDNIKNAQKTLSLAGQKLVGDSIYDVLNDTYSIIDDENIDVGSYIIDFRDEFENLR
jgi:hypothetical protein